MIHVVIENAKLNLWLGIPMGATIIVAKEAIENIADKRVKALLK